MIIGLHHFGFAVDDLDKAIELYLSMGFEVFKRFSIESINADAAMLKKNQSHIELWKFKDPNTKLNKKIAKHFAFESDNLEEDVQNILMLAIKYQFR